ncbi:tubulin-dependent ATPase kip3 [Elasticomyces elasticus]|nr:tubulin-dependent ATPase kip3 [Elasticomyces elasticus]KAK3653307.1 tubulin-dependent ATPase kip3 [Elasticomyces elasticus]KAK4918247.1 tubulin-dependent ATPase kip3 [Elasticomyces elasticus]KAK5758366.1 tubulin-dependent ATPase kip3 [Elasticomyces elasticus]
MLASAADASSIQVAVRVRPFTIREAAQLTRSDDGPLFLGDGSLAAVPTPQLKSKGIRSVIKVVDEKCLVFDPPEENSVQRFGRAAMPMGKRVKDQTFGFDRVFDENTTQADVYEATTKSLLDSVMDGYNATVFAYGATGCGKTHTITGTAQQPGIIFLTMQELFEKVDELQTEKESEITLSYLEIYNETIRDLLNPGAGGKQGLMLREDANQAVSVAGLSSHNPKNVQEVMDMVIRGNAHRTQSPTEANATSSRSHAVLQVNISLKDRNAATSEPLTMATLSIIDLAGSERASATKNRGERLLEGANINKSLLALGSCINALCAPPSRNARNQNHVPYRNSKLTRLLKFSLGGNCRTVMIVCVSPSSQHFDETQNTLRYANRAKNIQTKSVRNVYNVDRHVKDYLRKIEEQMARINELTAQAKQHEELAYAKFRKAEVKRGEIAHEGVVRIRAAFDNSSVERNERVGMMRRLRQVERRIGCISGWIGTFDSVCEVREESEDPPESMVAMRKTAQGILVELEGSRQHYHQRLGKNNWSRAVDTALQDGLRQLQSLDGSVEGGVEEQCLRREVELLKHRADLEAHSTMLEDAKVGEAGTVQVLLQVQFETVAILNQILQMSEQEAVHAARGVLSKLLRSCTESAGQVIKPDGGLNITDPVPPSRGGTPRKRKVGMPLLGPSPVKKLGNNRPSLALAMASAVPAHLASEASGSPNVMLGSSPMRPMASPRRRVRLGGARKGVAFGSTPKKKSPSKKRAVRWRDEDEGEEGKKPLVEFQVTPKPFESSPPEAVGAEMPAMPVLRYNGGEEDSSSPMPGTAFVPSSEVRKAATGRFAAGFLAKKAEMGGDSPAPPKLSSLVNFGSSEDEEGSPLREMAANSTNNKRGRQTLTAMDGEAKENVTDHSDAAEGSSTAGSGDERSFTTSSAGKTDLDKQAASAIRSAMKLKRSSSTNNNSRHSNAHRRRSPTASSTSHESPPPPTAEQGGNGIFSASHARRMVKSEREEALRSVLSPRTQPVVKQGTGPMAVRRSVAGVPSPLPSVGEGVGAKPAVRMSSILPGGATSSRVSGSIQSGKGPWR